MKSYKPFKGGNMSPWFNISARIWKLKETRAPRGTDRSPEYNEHFC